MPPTVLIVDDHPSFRLTARALLEAEGFEIVGEAEDGQSAIETARRLRPEVVLLDIQLPDIDGFGVRRGADLERQLARDRADVEPRRIGVRCARRAQRGAGIHPES